MRYVIGIDQSTQGTKAVLVDEDGKLAGRTDKKHRQIVDQRGWVSHDLEEIYQNVLAAVREVIEQNGIAREAIAAIGISNQRETTAAWKKDGTPIGNAIVWQCARAKGIVERIRGTLAMPEIRTGKSLAQIIEEKTGLPLSPYFPAAKMAWLIENQIPEAEGGGRDQEAKAEGGDGTPKMRKAAGGACKFLLGTMDSWLLYRLTEGKAHKTDMSNASRTQLFNLENLQWDEELCGLFGVPVEALPQVCDSNEIFGFTTLEGYWKRPVPICGVMGDSHAALFAQGCHERGMVKATYGTGSSVMVNLGPRFIRSSHGLATSLAWGIDGTVDYVLEGNINYTGAVITWLQELGLITSPAEVEPAIAKANPQDTTVLVPAFTGLSAPYWDNEAKALLYGMSRTTGRAELIKAAVESIAFQVADVLKAMETDSGIPIRELRVDGGPTRNRYLMQFQSDIARVCVQVPEAEEFSALGAAYMAGMKAGLYEKERLFAKREGTVYSESMEKTERIRRYANWKQALEKSRN